MTEPTPPAVVALPSPAAALERRFGDILRLQMHDVPMVNPALQVQAVGFRPWHHHWLGVLVTPWFMNLLLFPRIPAHWHGIGERESRHYVFPAGVFEFIGSRDATLGDYQACSLFSPMFDFANQSGAVDTAAAALEALFEPVNRQASEVPQPPAPASADTPPLPATPTPAVSKRDFLFGGKRRPTREP